MGQALFLKFQNIEWRVNWGKLPRLGNHWNLVARRHSFASSWKVSLSVALPVVGVGQAFNLLVLTITGAPRGPPSHMQVTQNGQSWVLSHEKFLTFALLVWCTLLKSISISFVCSGLWGRGKNSFLWGAYTCENLQDKIMLNYMKQPTSAAGKKRARIISE